MKLFPAIDLKDGQAVRLYQGDFATAHQVSSDPLATARDFVAAGAKYIHMVDLDGARSGKSANLEIVRSVAASTPLKVELGGGLRTMADLERADALGVWRMVIGSAAVSHPELIREAVARYGERIAVGLDARNGRVSVSGWTEDSGLNYLDFARQMEKLGVLTIIFTDIATDGALTGPSFGQLAELQRAVSCQIVASGGASSLEDIMALRDMGFYGAIIGKGYYTGNVDLAAAVEIGGEQ